MEKQEISNAIDNALNSYFEKLFYKLDCISTILSNIEKAYNKEDLNV